MGTETFSGPVSGHLRRGPDAAIGAMELARISGFGSTRELRRAVQAEREAGVPIISDPSGGYFLPSGGERGRAELAAYLERASLRAVRSLARLRPMRSALELCEDQLPLRDPAEGGGPGAQEEAGRR